MLPMIRRVVGVWVGGIMLLATCAQADTLYRCKAYSGGLFWSQAHCQTHGALIERMVSVPSGLNADSQIKLAEQGEREARRSVVRADNVNKAELAAVQRQARAREKQQARCAKLDARLDLQDSRSRQKASAYRQAQIAEQKSRLHDEQSRLGC